MYNLVPCTTYTVQQLDVDDSTTRKSDQGEAWPPDTPMALEKLKMSFNRRPIHRRTILKDWENKCIVAAKEHRGVHKDTLY